MKDITFEEYLQDKHADQYVGLDDEMGEDFEDWLSGLDIDMLLLLANMYGTERSSQTLKQARELFNTTRTMYEANELIQNLLLAIVFVALFIPVFNIFVS